jgi:hypothetical protein
MQRQDVWGDIQKALAELRADRTLASYDSALQQLERWSKVEPQPRQADFFMACIAFFQELRSDIQNNQPVQEKINRALAGTYVQDKWQVGNVFQANRDVINIILGDFRTPDPGIAVPVVLVVMNAEEAQQLVTREVFQRYPDVSSDFDELQRSLEGEKLTDWITRYRAAPEAWLPFRDKQESIEQIVRRVLSLIDGYQRPIFPEFIPIHQLNENQNRRKLKELRLEGCIVVMDIISIRHPLIQYAFRRSLLDVFPSTMIVRVAPTSGALNIVQQMITFSEQFVESELYKRFEDELDPNCANADRYSDFARWVKGQAEQLIRKKNKSEASPLSRMIQGGL